ncbi:hypothetical protein GCM10023231_03320 [Olivibacter ginsenosidimutans]|uniref:Carrier domain-containing protein n=1 Tax=Olivibacter ginsenosidimutans TaxID=1176537 RepID=A0ABP9ADS3_9SPHI
MEENYILEPITYNPFSTGEIYRVVPTTDPQKEIWISCSLGEKDANLAYNESISLRLNGSLQVDAFTKALYRLVDRHESLRTTFSANGDWLFIHTTFPFQVHRVDLSPKAGHQEATLNAFLQQEVATPFDLFTGPLFRFTLHQLSNNEYIFTLTAHHIICDGWSLGILLEDISKLYDAQLHPDTKNLPEPSSFATYAVQQYHYTKSEAYAETLAYWVNKIKKDPAAVILPLDFERPSIRTYSSKRLDYTLDRSLVQALKKLATTSGCSFVTTLFASFELFLYQLTGQRTLMIGLPTAGQATDGNFFLTGHCVNLLPIQCHIDPQQSFTSYLKRRKSQLLDDLDHQQLSFGKLVQNLHLPRDPARIPLVPITFNVDLGMDANVRFEGIKHHLLYNPRICETFEVFLNIADYGDELELQWSYNTDLFKASSIQQWAAAYKELLIQLTQHPEIPISTLLQSPINDLPVDLTGKTLDVPKHRSVAAALSESCMQFRDQPAISFYGDTITYAALEERANQLANYLVQQGVKTGVKIALLLPRTPQLIISLYAIMKTGATYVALDVELPQERMRFMLEDSDSSYLLTLDAYGKAFATTVSIISLTAIEPIIAAQATSFAQPTFDAQDILYVLYTSGSTGKPKGVQITQSNLLNLLYGVQSILPITQKDRVLAITTISFDISIIELFLPLLCGSTIVLADGETVKDQGRLLQLIQKEQVSLVQATPSRWQLLLQSTSEQHWSFTAIATGEPLPKQLAEALVTQCDALWNGYGPTETTVWSTLKKITADEQTISIGTPLPNTVIYVLNEQQQPVNKGVKGEIYIAGDGVSAGYFNRPEITSASFLPIPFASPFQTMYRTGDLGRINERNELECFGRIDHQVKLRGYRIELDEIAYHLTKIEAIEEAIVVLREDRPGDQRLVAYLKTPSLLSTDTVSAQAAKEHVRLWRDQLMAYLPAYMLPNDWICMREFPLTSNQKIDKQRLPAPHVFQLATASRVSLSPEQKLIKEVWKEALGLQHIGLDDNFFELGGHSLIAVQVMLRLEKETGKRFPLASLFEYPTINALANLFQSDVEILQLHSLVAIKPTGTKPPIYLVHGGGLNVLIYQPLGNHVSQDQPLYALQAIGLSGKKEIPSTIAEIARIYLAEVLRHNPNGPYALAGYSLGGIIAYEMAKQLLAMGRQVLLLGIMDTNADGRDWQLPMVKRLLKKTVRQFKKIKHFVQSYKHYPSDTINYQLQALKRLKFFQTVEEPIDEDLFSNEPQVAQAYDDAYNKYVFQPLAIKIHLFRVSKRIYYVDDPVYLGWKAYALKGVEICPIPGDHKTFLYPPNNQVFAHTLENKLQEIIEEQPLQETTHAQ